MLSRPSLLIYICYTSCAQTMVGLSLFVDCVGDKRLFYDNGSGTGGLAIFLWKSFQIDITTSDYDDSDIEENIAHNCKVNGVIPVLPHIKREHLCP